MVRNLNIGSSVVKRESSSIGTVENKLLRDGWEKTSSALSGRVRYFEKSGINITVLQGALGTLVFPSGPFRGTIFGSDAVGIGSVSNIGLGANPSEKESKDETVRTQQRSGDLT